MFRSLDLTPHLRAVSLAVALGSFLLTTACQKGSVTEVANANPNQPTNAPPNNPAAGTTTAPAVASPAPNGQPGLPTSPAPSLAPGERQISTGVAPDYQPPTPTPAAGASTSPASSMRRVDNGAIKITPGIPDPSTMGPPPTPTPTPAATPAVEMVNGKIKQQWEAPAEFQAMKNPLKVTADIVKRGQYLYKNRCELCHGPEGKGNGSYNDPKWKQASNLSSKVVQANSDGALFYKVSTSRDRHPASKVLYTEEERWMVVSFLRTLK